MPFIAPQDMIPSFDGKSHCFFLDSSSQDRRLGRFSFLGCDPFLVFTSKRSSVRLDWRSGKREAFSADPFSVLKDLLARYRMKSRGGQAPLSAGAVGYFSYDLKDFVEKLPDRAKDDMCLPDCILGFYDNIITYDHISGKAHSQDRPEHGIPPIRLADDIRSVMRHGAVKSNFSREEYISAVEIAKEYIKKGDIYQVNLSQRFEADLAMKPSELYPRLRHFSPAPFSSYLKFGDIAIASSSPERFMLKRGDYIETRPIKGTRPRGKSPAEDAMLADELRRSQKDRAEHIMIVDLERNDLGRICEYGSVKPTESFVLEKYANVFHLVSTVTGKLKSGVDPVDCLLATFPGGSITGAPKIRSMEIIEELEPVKRSVYTGAIGYISFDGNMDTSIAIRTFIIKGRKAYFQVGGGIVADSVPELEYEETLHKASGMMAALGVGSEKKALAAVNCGAGR